MNNLEIYEKYRTVPKEAQKEIKGGRMKGMTDINPMWRVKALTEQFGPCGIGWYYVPVRKWLETSGDEIAAFVDIELFIKVNGEWSMPISGTGGSAFATQEKGGIYVSDECYKMATTDAISVACKQLGFGADVYWGADKSKYDKPSQDKQTSEPIPPPNPDNEIISKNEADVLASMVKRKGLDIAKVFNVPVEQLTKAQYVAALKQLEGLRDKQVK
jgi:hypothetical protein